MSSAKRHVLLPEVPSIQEAGVRDLETVARFGGVAPAATPRDIVNRLNGETLKALQVPEVRMRLLDSGSDIISGTPEAADRFLREELKKWGKVVKAAKLTPG